MPGTKIKKPTRQALREGIALARRRYAEDQGMGELAGAIIGPLLWQHDRLAALCRQVLDAPAGSEEALAPIRAGMLRALTDAGEPAGLSSTPVPAPKSKGSDGAAAKVREKAGKHA